MTKKAYDSPQYVAQKLRDSLEKLLEKKSGSNLFYEVTYSHNPDTNENFISYKIMGIKSEITITKEGKKSRYQMVEEIFEISNKDSKETYKLELHPRRSKTERISDHYMNDLARESFSRFKEYHKSKQ